MNDLIDTLEPPHPADARLEEDTRLDRRELAGTLARIRDLKSYIKDMKEEQEALESQLKAALEADREPIIDGELGLVATLIERNRPAEIDFITLANKPEAGRWLVEAAKQGLITARLTQVRGLKGKSEAADALLKASMPGGTSFVLQIESTK